MKAGLRLGVLLAALPVAALAQPTPKPEHIRAPGNPIMADGRYYSTDPAPVVLGDTLWILTGRDVAPAGVNDFIMPEWQLLETRDPGSGDWTHYPAIARPEAVFQWAEPGRAYAGQIVRGGDGRLYMYAPVLQRDCGAKDCFGIGVAVADSPAGPWTDAHPSGPIISETVPVANDMQNIDPTVLVDDDKRVYIYWGTFGRLRGMELAPDMVTPKGAPVQVRSLTGFFEAAWLMKRKGTYYLLYAGNEAGPGSPCTPAVYHACQAYGTAPTPLGPWTYRGVFLGPVSSTTSHGGAVEFKSQWWFAYHTADAAGGGHFRRSVAIDRMAFDDNVSPPAILPITPTKRPAPATAPDRNIARFAAASASNEPVPAQYWIAALNDGLRPTAPLPPDMWGTWHGADNPAQPWVQYRWDRPVTLNGSRIWFWADHPAGAGEGVAPPKRWHLEYWDGGWKPVPGAGAYGTAADQPQETRFPPVTTRCVRAVFDASQAAAKTAAVAVTEWEMLAPAPTRLPPASPGGCD